MSMITFSENHESSLIAFEDGKALASLSDPRVEGLKWAYSLGVIPTSHVVVIGLGSGFHIAALTDLDPHLQITVIETREALIPVFRSQFPEVAERINIVIVQDERDIVHSDFFQDVIAQRSCILSFKECWGNQSKFFSKIFAHLTGRSSESVQYHFQEFGINMKALYFKPNNLLSIKDVIPVVEASTLSENNKQMFRILGELVK